MGRARGASLRGVALGVAAMLLAACAGIPTSGRVAEGDPVGVEEPPPLVWGGEPEPPTPGAGPVEVITGFMEAMESYQPGYTTAQLFLTPEAAAEWQPLSGMTIYDNRRQIRASTGPAVTLTVPVDARYDRGGGYVRAPAATVEEFEIELEQVEDEWRISNPPDGVIVSEFDFGNDFEAFNLYYFDPEFAAFVPDPIYLPARSNVLATMLVQELLRGPSDWLAPAVRTAFPEGSRLDPEAVAVVAGYAEVNLSSEAAAGPDGSQTEPDVRERMVDQLALTLGQLRGVSHVVVTAAALPLIANAEVPVAPPDGDPASSPEVDLYAIADSGVVVMDGGSAADGVARVEGALGEYSGAMEVAVNRRGSHGAVVDASGSRLVAAELSDQGVAEILVEGTELTSPVWDRTGLVWVIDSEVVVDGEVAPPVEGAAPAERRRSRLLVAEPGGGSGEVDAPELAGRHVESISLAPDGTRVACVVDGAVYVGIVVRDPDDAVSVVVEGLRPVALDLIDAAAGNGIAGVAWSTSNELAVVTQVADVAGGEPGGDTGGDGGGDGEPADLGENDVEAFAPVVYVVELGVSAPANPRGPVRAAWSITAAAGNRIAVGTAEGEVRVLSETLRWDTVADVRAPAYPG